MFLRMVEYRGHGFLLEAPYNQPYTLYYSQWVVTHKFTLLLYRVLYSNLLLSSLVSKVTR